MALETRGVGAGPNWTRRIVLGLAALAVLAFTYFLGVTLLPRWWAHWIGDRVDGGIVGGWFLGLTIGLLFTLLPLVIARQVVRPVGLRTRIALVVTGLVVAFPNLLTLVIVLGSGNGAHAGERILDVEGPGFRAGSAVGAILAVVLMLVVTGLTWRARRSVPGR
jgi:hypothetical protein